MKHTIVTNNPKCQQTHHGTAKVLFDQTWTYGDVLLQARDLIHRGMGLVTHPMVGSLKPNETPYRTVILTDTPDQQAEPFQDIMMIEHSIAMYNTYFSHRPLPTWTAAICEEFQMLDMILVENAL